MTSSHGPVSKAPVKSPCIGVCDIANTEKLCRGCFRYGAEISRWPIMTEQEKQQIIDQITDRQAQYQQKQSQISAERKAAWAERMQSWAQTTGQQQSEEN